MKRWRRWLRRRRGLRRGPIVLAVFLVALAAVPAAFTHTSYREIDSVASWLAMREVSVICQTEEESQKDVVISIWGASAYVDGWFDHRGNWHPSSTSVFAHGICEVLLEVRSGYIRDWEDSAWAILVLTHEAGHLRGHRWSRNEAKTECWAIRHFRYAAQRLGVSDPGALSTLVGFAVRVHRGLSPDYRLKGCKLPRP